MKLRCLTLLAALLVLTSSPLLEAADWPQFRGPGRNGVSRETGLLDSWPEGGPPVLWRADIGVGGGSCAIVGERLYVLGALSDPESSERRPPRRDSLICLNVADGQRLWDTPLGGFTKERTYHSPHVTPTVFDGRVYAADRTGHLACFNAESGEIQWQVETAPLMGDADHSHYGYSCSALVRGGRVFVWSRYGKGGLPPELRETLLSAEEREDLRTMDPEKRERFFWRIRCSMLAFDAETGRLLWRTRPLGGSTRNDLASPMVGEFGGREMVLWPTGTQLAAVRPEDGEVLWQFDYKKAFDLDNLGPSHSNVSPVVVDDLVIDQLWNHKATNRTFCVRVGADGPQLVWQTSKMVSWYHSYVARQGLLLGLDNQGLVKGSGAALPGTRPPEIGMLQCYDLRTGELLWHANEFGSGIESEKRLAANRPGYILADGKLIIQSREGVSLVRVDREGARVMSAFELERRSRAYAIPSLADGRLYIRQTRGELVCFDLRTESWAKPAPESPLTESPD